MLSYKFRVLLLSVLSSQVLAAPWEQSSKHNTHSVRNVARGTSIETYFPESTYEVRNYYFGGYSLNDWFDFMCRPMERESIIR